MHRKVPLRDGTDYDDEILCSLEDARTISPNYLSELYWRCLDILARKHATEIPYKTKSGIDIDFFNTPESPGPADIDVSATKKNRNWELTLRNTPRIERIRKALHLNYDLAIVVPTEGRVLTILFDILGRDIINESSAGQLSFIRRLLVDLQVRCAYTPLKRELMIQGKKGDAFLLNGAEPGSCQFRITEVRPHSEVKEFIPEGFDRLESVQTFVNNRILPDGEKAAGDAFFYEVQKQGGEITSFWQAEKVEFTCINPFTLANL
ncbi:hypothetical protein BKA63DRAFT_586700 [Paraphoma chrysanthemicola]|nr:hypothetical protein BKA63DRAFT_586700 [Paraphoma chrysanthemicola]